MEAEMKQMLMAKEFEYNMQLAQGKNQGKEQMQNVAEDRKDNRTKLQATQQSEMIQQRQQDGMPTDFESSGNDSMGGFDLSTFEPQ